MSDFYIFSARYLYSESKISNDSFLAFKEFDTILWGHIEMYETGFHTNFQKQSVFWVES